MGVRGMIAGMRVRFAGALLVAVLPPLALAVAEEEEEVGSAACAGCHAGIARQYAATGMAQSAAGRARAIAVPAAIGNYSVTGTGAGIRLAFPGGERRLGWSVGSGRVGHSFLFDSGGGFLFQAPVSYYSRARSWNLSPGFEQLRGGQFTRPVGPACLQCHASRVQHREGTVNGYADPPFLEAGVSCERCHGAGGAHVKDPASARMVNPSKLEPEQRDSVCQQCHLTGAARIARTGAQERYRPGARLADSLAILVWKEPGGSTAGATGHAEGLARSGCANMAGTRLSCLSCHDPHSEPAPAARASFYRERCQRCHAAAQSACRAKGRTDCIACHMPRRQSAAGADHLAFTDHSIPRAAQLTAVTKGAAGGATSAELVDFWKRAVSPRDLALAYTVAAATRPGAGAKAAALLAELDRSGAAESSNDAALISELAQWHDKRGGAAPRARELYQRVLTLDPSNTTASVNLGNLLMKSGDGEAARRLWSAALERNPGLTAARLNLGIAQYRSGQRDEAIATLRKALEFEPNLEPARRLLSELGVKAGTAR